MMTIALMVLLAAVIVVGSTLLPSAQEWRVTGASMVAVGLLVLLWLTMRLLSV